MSHLQQSFEALAGKLYGWNNFSRHSDVSLHGEVIYAINEVQSAWRMYQAMTSRTEVPMGYVLHDGHGSYHFRDARRGEVHPPSARAVFFAASPRDEDLSLQAQYQLEKEQSKSLQLTVAALTRDVQHWKANHANMVARKAVLEARPDLPADRTTAYRELVRLQELNAHLCRTTQRYKELYNLSVHQLLKVQSMSAAAIAELAEELEQDPDVAIDWKGCASAMASAVAAKNNKDEDRSQGCPAK